MSCISHEVNTLCKNYTDDTMLKKKNIKYISSVLSLILLSVFLNSCQQFMTQKKNIKIGAILPLTGKSAQYGTWIKEALELGKEQINTNGGIQGKSLEIIYEDDQATPNLAVNAIHKLIDIDKVLIVYGSWASSSVLAEAPIAEKTKTILLAQAISPKIREAGDYIFRMQPDASYYIKELVPFIAKNTKIKKISILAVNNDFGVDQARVFKEKFTALGGQVISSEKFDQNANDFKAELTKIRNQQPDAIFIPAYAESAIIVKQARELGLKQQFFASVPFENPDILKVAGNTANGVIYPYHFDADSSSEMVVKYQDSYKLKYSRQSEGVAALAYDGIKIIESILKQCGDEDRECLKQSLYKVQKFPGVAGITSFDKKGDVIKPIIIKIVKDGKFSSINNK
jgi:branched-chain amino acid transport system substrate-binding protein